MMNKKKRVAALSLAAAMSLSLAACSGGDNGGDTRELKTFVDWQTQANESSTFLMLYSEERANSKVLCNAYSPLLEYDNHGKLQPAMAESWNSADGSTTWTFNIRKGIHWVNQAGEEMDECTAWDWMTAMEWVLNYHKNQSKNTSMPLELIEGANEYYEYTKSLTEEEAYALKATDEKFLSTVGMEVQDDYTLIYHLVKGAPYFETLAACACLYPLPQGQIDVLGIDGTFSQDPSTMWFNGPYRITEYTQNNSKVFTKNDSYWDTEGDIFDTVTVMMVQDALTDDEMFMNGELDRTELSESRLRTIYESEDNQWKDYLVQPRTVAGNRQFLLNYAKNNEDGTPDTNWNTAIANENFRKSIYWGTDLTGIWSYYNFIEPENCRTETFTTSGLASFSDGTDYVDRVIELIGVDMDTNRWETGKAAEYVAAAKEELTAQGVTFPVKMTYYIKAGDQAAQDLATIIKSAVEGIAGKDYIEFETKTYISSSTQEVTNPSLHSIYLASWAADYGDPENFVNQLIRGDDAAYFGNRVLKVNQVQGNAAAEQLDTYTNMVQAANLIVDDLDERYEAQAEAEAYLYQHALIIPIFQNTPWQLTRSNCYESAYASYGLQMDTYKNFGTTTEKAYTSEEYKQFAADFAAGK